MSGPPGIGGLFLEGHDSDGERFVILGAQYPERLPGFDGAVTKQVLERFHLARFEGDYLLRRGTSPFDMARAGGDPPDFVVTSGGRDQTLDCAVLPLQDWRNSYRLFSRFLDRLNAEAGDYDLSGLAGSEVGVYFEKTSGLPPKRSDDSIIRPLLELMHGQRIDHDAAAAFAASAANGFPPNVPEGVMAAGMLPNNLGGFFANPIVDPRTGGVPLDRPLAVALHKTETVGASRALGILQALVTSHDKPEIDHLLVTAGGPDRDGLRYPGEEAVARFIIDQGMSVVARHLQQLTLHLWGEASVHEVIVNRRASPGPRR